MPSVSHATGHPGRGGDQGAASRALGTPRASRFAKRGDRRRKKMLMEAVKWRIGDSPALERSRFQKQAWVTPKLLALAPLFAKKVRVSTNLGLLGSWTPEVESNSQRCGLAVLSGRPAGLAWHVLGGSCGHWHDWKGGVASFGSCSQLLSRRGQWKVVKLPSSQASQREIPGATIAAIVAP